MTASEFAFLALGVVLGVATGAALMEIIRARPPGRREIRVTVAPNSIPARRASTLSDASPGDPTSGPAARGPGDRRWTDREEPDPGEPELDVGEPVAPRPNRTDVPDRPLAAPTPTPSTSPSARKANSLAVTLRRPPRPDACRPARGSPFGERSCDSDERQIGAAAAEAGALRPSRAGW